MASMVSASLTCDGIYELFGRQSHAQSGAFNHTRDILSPCCPVVPGLQLETLTRNGELEGFMRTFAVLIDERTGSMRGVQTSPRQTKVPASVALHTSLRAA